MSDPRYREIAAVVRRHGGKQSAAARELGIAPSTVTVAMLRARVETLEMALQEIDQGSADPFSRRTARRALSAEPPHIHNAPQGGYTGLGASQSVAMDSDATPRLSAAPDGAETAVDR